MNEKNFKLLALVISIIGLLILYIMTLFIKYEDYSITSEQDEKIKIKGEIISYNNNKNITRIKIRHTLITDAVIFDDAIDKKINPSQSISTNHKNNENENTINKNINNTSSIVKNITIIGKVDNYKGRRQVIVEEVR